MNTPPSGGAFGPHGGPYPPNGYQPYTPGWHGPLHAPGWHVAPAAAFHGPGAHFPANPYGPPRLPDGTIVYPALFFAAATLLHFLNAHQSSLSPFASHPSWPPSAPPPMGAYNAYHDRCFQDSPPRDSLPHPRYNSPVGGLVGMSRDLSGALCAAAQQPDAEHRGDASAAGAPLAAVPPQPQPAPPQQQPVPPPQQPAPPSLQSMVPPMRTMMPPPPPLPVLPPPPLAPQPRAAVPPQQALPQQPSPAASVPPPPPSSASVNLLHDPNDPARTAALLSAATTIHNTAYPVKVPCLAPGCTATCGSSFELAEHLNAFHERQQPDILRTLKNDAAGTLRHYGMRTCKNCSTVIPAPPTSDLSVPPPHHICRCPVASCNTPFATADPAAVAAHLNHLHPGEAVSTSARDPFHILACDDCSSYTPASATNHRCVPCRFQWGRNVIAAGGQNGGPCSALHHVERGHRVGKNSRYCLVISMVAAASASDGGCGLVHPAFADPIRLANALADTIRTAPALRETMRLHLASRQDEQADGASGHTLESYLSTRLRNGNFDSPFIAAAAVLGRRRVKVHRDGEPAVTHGAQFLTPAENAMPPIQLWHDLRGDHYRPVLFLRRLEALPDSLIRTAASHRGGDPDLRAQTAIQFAALTNSSGPTTRAAAAAAVAAAGASPAPVTGAPPATSTQRPTRHARRAANARAAATAQAAPTAPASANGTTAPTAPPRLPAANNKPAWLAAPRSPSSPSLISPAKKPRVTASAAAVTNLPANAVAKPPASRTDSRPQSRPATAAAASAAVIAPAPAAAAAPASAAAAAPASAAVPTSSAAGEAAPPPANERQRNKEKEELDTWYRYLVDWVEGRSDAAPAGIPPLPPPSTAATQRRAAANHVPLAIKAWASRTAALLSVYKEQQRAKGRPEVRAAFLTALLSAPLPGRPWRGGAHRPLPKGLTSGEHAAINRATTILGAAADGLNVPRTYSKAAGVLAQAGAGGVLSTDDPSVANALRGKYPPAAPGPPVAVLPSNPQDAPRLDRADVRAVIAGLDPTGGPDNNGWKPAHLLGLLGLRGVRTFHRNPGSPTTMQILDGITAVVNDIAQGFYTDNDEVRGLLTTLRGVALEKKDGKPRPIGILPLFTKITMMLLMRTDELGALIEKATGPTDMGIGVKGGVEAVPTLLTALLKANPTHCLLTTDVENAFNSISTPAVLACGQLLPPLRPAITFLYSKPIKVVYRGSAVNSVPLTIDVLRGTIQGSPEGSLICSAVIAPCVRAVQEALPAVAALGVADDRTFVASLEDLLQAIPIYERELETKGLKCNRGKQFLVCGPGADRAAAASVAHQLGVNLVDGAEVCGGPVGTDAWIDGFLRAKFDAAIETVAKVEAQARHAVETHHRSLAHTLKLTRYCLGTAPIMHLLATTPPRLVEPHAQRYDAAVQRLVLAIARVELDDELYDVRSVTGARALRARCLTAAGGGLGIGGAVQFAEPRRLGHLLLVTHLGFKRGILPADLDMAVALPELAALLAKAAAAVKAALPHHEKYFPELAVERKAAQQLAQFTPQHAVDQQLFGTCRMLTRVTRATSLHEWLDAAPSDEHKAWALSNMNESAQWLLAHDQLPGTTLGPAEISVIVRWKLGLCPHPGLATNGPCTRASGCHQREEPTGLHLLKCRAPSGAGGHSMAGRHAHVKQALFAALGRVARSSHRGASAPLKGEPKIGDYVPTRAGYIPPPGDEHDSERRGDIVCPGLPGGPAIFDLVISHPRPAAGAAAAAAYSQKLRSYNGRYDFTGCASFFPISIEAGGRWHPQSREHVERYIRWCIGNGDDKAIDKALYNESLRDVTVSVGRALASYQASTVLAAAGKQAAW